MAMLNNQMVKTIHFWCFDNCLTYDMSTLSTWKLQRIRNSHGGKQPWLFLVGGTRHISSMNQSQSVEQTAPWSLVHGLAGHCGGFKKKKALVSRCGALRTIRTIRSFWSHVGCQSHWCPKKNIKHATDVAFQGENSHGWTSGSNNGVQKMMLRRESLSNFGGPYCIILPFSQTNIIKHHHDHHYHYHILLYCHIYILPDMYI